jgi:DNA-binding CsgD family transcriptional regulator
MRSGARPYAHEANGDRARKWGREMRPSLRTEAPRGSVIDPAVEKYLLGLHAAMDLASFWTAAEQLLSATIPGQVVGLTLKHNPISPLIARWTAPMPAGFFVSQPLKKFIATQPGKKIVQLAELFSTRKRLVRSTLYRRYIAPQKCAHAVCLCFWQKRRLVCAIVILRTAAQGKLAPPEMKLLRQLYPQFSIALERLRSLERERAVRIDLEEFVKRLPLPTMLLRWNLKLLFQNRAARDFCAIWEKGFEQARLTNARSPVPPEILGRCRRLKKRCALLQDLGGAKKDLEPERASHPQSPNLRATIYLKQLNSVVAQPHFLIECEDLGHRDGAPVARLKLPHLVRLTGREQEVAGLACNGQSNQEIADSARLSLPMVKKHLHAVFRKLEVTSRSQLLALML